MPQIMEDRGVGPICIVPQIVTDILMWCRSYHRCVQHVLVVSLRESWILLTSAFPDGLGRLSGIGESTVLRSRSGKGSSRGSWPFFWRRMSKYFEKQTVDFLVQQVAAEILRAGAP